MKIRQLVTAIIAIPCAILSLWFWYYVGMDAEGELAGLVAYLSACFTLVLIWLIVVYFYQEETE